MENLSSLSNDIMGKDSFGKKQRFGINADEIASVKAEKEPSLEEKYKDAVPLAEQIALEEEKRRHKPRAVTTETIDRSRTANALVSESESEISDDANPEKRDYEVVGVRFREAGKVYYFDPAGNDIPFGTPVIVDTARGSEYGYTAISNRRRHSSAQEDKEDSHKD